MKQAVRHLATQLPLEASKVQWYGNLLVYAAECSRGLAGAAVWLTLVLGSSLRSVLGVIRDVGLKPAHDYGRVIPRAGFCIAPGYRAGIRLSSVVGTLEGNTGTAS